MQNCGAKVPELFFQNFRRELRVKEADVSKALDDVSTFLSELPPDAAWTESRGNHTPERFLVPVG